MSRTDGNWLLALAVVAAWSVAAEVCADDNKTEAKRHFDAGLVYFEAESYSAAVIEFEASVKLFPTRMGFFNLANCLKALLRFDEALAVVDRMESELGKELDRKWKGDLASFRNDLRELGGELAVTTNPDGAVVSVGGRLVGTTPLDRPVLLAPGEHLVEVTKTGYEHASRTVRLVSRGSETLELSLEPEKPTESPPHVETGFDPATNESGPPAESKGGSGLFWAGAGLAVVSGVIGGVMYGMASSRAGDYDGAKTEYEALSPASASYEADEARLWKDAEGAREDVGLYSKVGLGAVIAAGAFAAAAVVVLAVGSGESGEKPAVALRPVGTGLVLEF